MEVMNKLKTLFWKVCSVLSKLVGVGIDKPAHFLVSFAYALLISSIFGTTTGLVSTISLGIGKEYGDSKSPNNKWSWSDIVADVLGALLGVACQIELFYIL